MRRLVPFFLMRYLFSRSSIHIIRRVARMSIVGTALAMFALVVVASVMNGFGHALKNRLSRYEPHVLVQGADLQQTQLSELLQGYGVRQIEPYERSDLIFKTVDGFFNGVDARLMPEDQLSAFLQSIVMKNLTVPQLNDRLPKVSLAVDLARSMGVFEGDEITLISPEALFLPDSEVPQVLKVQVGSIFQTNIPELDGHVLFAPIGLLGAIQKWTRGEKGFQLFLQDPFQSQKVKELLVAKGFQNVSTWEERYSNLFYSLKLEKIMMTIFLFLILIIANFSILILLSLLVTQKRRDLGILHTMGYSFKQIRRLFLGIGMTLSAAGILIGLVFGSALCFLFQRYPFLKLPNIYYETDIPFDFEPRSVLLIAACGLGCSFVGCWYALRASLDKTSIQLLRH